MVVGLVVAMIGWAVVGFLVLVRLFTGEETNCVAHRGAAYRDCVRGGDLTALTLQGVVIGLAMAAMVIVVAGVHRQRGHPTSTRMRVAVVAAGSLVVVSIVGWILGAQGLWSPDRPFPYDPIAASLAHTILAAGGLIGLAIGTLVSVLSRPEATP